MGKVIGAIVAGVVSFIVMFNVASVSSGGGKFDYATATEERQQKYLEGVANGFSAGFKLTAGKRAELSRVEADASIDMISITIQYKDEKIENVTGQQIGQLKKMMQKTACKMADKKKMLESGVTMRMRLKRPSGSQMTGFDINAADCAPFLT